MKINSRTPWIVCLSAALFFFYEFIQMGMFNSISPDLMRTFAISATELGNLSATYFYADVIFLLFAGVLLDYFPTRIIILSAMGLCVFTTFIFAISTSLVLSAICHFAAGIGNAFCFLSCITLASRWFPPQRMALIIGLTVTMAMAGGVVSQTPLTYLVELLGWRHAVMVDGLLGVILLIVIWFYVQDKPNTKAASSTTKHLHPETIFSLKKKLHFAFSNKQNWLSGIYTCLLNLPIFLLGDLWGIMYLNQVHNIARTDASYITMMVFIGTIIGAPLVGWYSDRVAQRCMPMIIGAIFSLLIILLIMFMPHLSFFMLLLLFLALGFFTSTQIISYPTIAESNPKALTGTATGLASVLIMGGGAVFQPLFGWLMDLRWNGLTVNGTAIYSPHDYLLGMAIMPVAIAIGLIASLLIRETYCQPYANHANN